MTAYITNTASATWNVATHFTPTGIPTFGDTVIIANGHTLTIPTGYTAECGDSAAPTTAAVATSAGGTGVLVVNGTLRVAADIRQGNATWVVQGAGATVESTNTTTALVWYVSDNSNQNNARLDVLGTGIGANRAVVRNGAGAAGFRITHTGLTAGHVHSFAKFSGLGTAGVAGIQFRLNSGTNGFISSDTVYENCGQIIHSGSMQINNPLQMNRVLVKGSLNGRAVSLACDLVNAVAARTLTDVACTQGHIYVAFPSSGTVAPTFTRCYFGGGFELFSGLQGEFVDCVFRRNVSGAGGTTVSGNVTRGFSVANNAAIENWHGLNVTNNGRSTVCDGVIVDGVHSGDDTGDLFFVSGTSAGTAVTIRNVLCTVSVRANGAYGKMVNTAPGDGTNPSLVLCENNTWITSSAEAGFLKAGETIVGYSGMIGVVRNNLIWGRAANQGQALGREGAGAAANIRDYMSAANVTNNALVNPYNGGVNGDGHYTLGGGDGLMWTGAIPTYTTSSDPDMVDDTRNLATWYRSVVGGTPGTRTADMELALTGIAEQWGDSPTAGLTIPAAWTWIRAGFRPQNAALKTNASANNGGWIGAMEGVNAGTLTFTQQPQNSWNDEPIRPAIVVTSSRGAAADGTTVTLSVNTGAGSAAGTLTAVCNASGVATFNGTAKIVGSGAHTLAANATDHAQAVSNAFNVATGTGVPGGGNLTYTEADMQYDTRARSAASQTGEVLILNTDGTPATGLVFNTSGLACNASTDGGASAAVTLATMTLGTYASGGFVQINATTRPGWYAFGYPTLPSSGNRRVFTFTGTGLRAASLIVDLTADDSRAAGVTSASIATEVLAAATATPIAANVEQINGVTITGNGSSGDKFDVV